MSDLNAQIHARLDDPAWRNLLRTAGGQVMQRAILAAIDLHKPEFEHSWEAYRPQWAPWRKPSGPLRAECSVGQEHQVAYPCRTVKAIANALVIEADDG
jgi:hypothetical protein